MNVTLYGISNCDTVRKARRWLDTNSIDYRFHDLRKDGLDKQMLEAWLRQAGWETLLNRRGTTWRQLDVAVRESIDAASAAGLMLEHPTLIKRPVLDRNGEVSVGFSDSAWSALF